MADILTDEQVNERERDYNILLSQFEKDLLAKLRHVQTSRDGWEELCNEYKTNYLILVQENARLQAENERLLKCYSITNESWKELRQENARLREALAVYAKESSWNNEKLRTTDGCAWIRSSWMGDDAYGYTVARQALATEGSTEE